MTIEQAKHIKELRCVDELTWRSIADECPELITNDMYNTLGRQQIGIRLCEDAMMLLNETYKINPEWNS